MTRCSDVGRSGGDGRSRPLKDRAASEATLARHDGYRHEGLGFFTVERKADWAVIGFCGLKRGDPLHPIAGEIEAGWQIAQPFWRQGYALEAMRAVFEWGGASSPCRASSRSPLSGMSPARG
ncbi:acetyltransferase (GNAT) domain-containing protein [Ditylenchus destructor]|uniref:Acetyltransferase (GNAT) domain-containing protein n=1 Tax=Ditylenchus destructor TaxID=166010 RepID=A0AAD4MEK8_9BILA|nr:acetyltransferase (GNAT) domain-containing protein [Ditylenchus destructor]